MSVWFRPDQYSCPVELSSPQSMRKLSPSELRTIHPPVGERTNKDVSFVAFETARSCLVIGFTLSPFSSESGGLWAKKKVSRLFGTHNFICVLPPGGDPLGSLHLSAMSEFGLKRGAVSHARVGSETWLVRGPGLQPICPDRTSDALGILGSG